MRINTNQRFGHLVTLERVYSNKWRCLCDCGNEKIIFTANLKQGKTPSCGCLQKELKHDITGQRFGRLTVLERVSGKTWRCLCDCGKEKIVTTNCLMNDFTRSCGCLQQESHCADITGQRFGHLIALESLNKVKNNSVLWHFKCDCGNECEATVDSVKWSGRRSCGCLQHESKVRHAVDMQKNCERINGTYINNIISKKIYRNNTSGYKGVHWGKNEQKWVARIQFQGKLYHLGYHDQLEDAAKARAEAEKRLHGPFLEWYEEYKQIHI